MNVYLDWDVSPASAVLPARNTVDCWQIDVRSFDESHCLSLLDHHEKIRAERFVRANDRRSYVVSHAALRQLLARALQLDPPSVTFEKNHYGKPSIAGTILSFNLSHSGDIALIALATNTQVGVDIERVRRLSNMQAITQRFFHPQEAAEIQVCPNAEQLPTFFRYWTRKEAVLKALGTGLTRPLRSFRVTPDCDTDELGCSLTDLTPHPDYVGAVAALGQPIHVRRRRLAHIGEQ